MSFNENDMQPFKNAISAQQAIDILNQCAMTSFLAYFTEPDSIQVKAKDVCGEIGEVISRYLEYHGPEKTWIVSFSLLNYIINFHRSVMSGDK